MRLQSIKKLLCFIIIPAYAKPITPLFRGKPGSSRRLRAVFFLNQVLDVFQLVMERFKFTAQGKVGTELIHQNRHQKDQNYPQHISTSLRLLKLKFHGNINPVTSKASGISENNAVPTPGKLPAGKYHDRVASFVTASIR